MHYKKLGFFIFILAIIKISNIVTIKPFEKHVLGSSARSGNLVQVETDFPIVLETKTAFEQIIEPIYEEIPFKTEYIENDEMEYGTNIIITEGKSGLKTKNYLIIHWLGEQLDKSLMETLIEDPVTEVIEKGTKVVWRIYETADVGGIWYWHKLRVWATKYDANCEGCWGRTFSGTEVKRGVCAVDPTVIPLGTNFYVEGYGLCRAEDIGGAIKGNDVDLGFVDTTKAKWGAEYTNIYLITSSPDGSSKY